MHAEHLPRSRFTLNHRGATVALMASLVLGLAPTGCTGSASTAPAEVASPSSQDGARPSQPFSAGGEPASDALEAESTNYGHASREAPQQPARAAEKREAYPTDSSAGEYDTAPAPPAWRRPGLATQWGEARDSQVREVSFYRQNPSSPAAALRVQYDDVDGIRSATGRDESAAYDASFPLHGGDIVVRLEDSSGDALPTLQAGGRNYVIGESGDRYQIRIDNNTPGRFEIVASVDGLDVLDGAEAGFQKRGYLVNPWSQVTIEGFRDSFETVRAFRFGDVSSSYAALRGKGGNIGVIGVAVFEERGFRWQNHPGELWRRDQADPFPNRFAPAP